MEHISLRESELTSQGWTRQFSAGPPRLEDAVEAYREMGFDVILEPAGTGPPDGPCTACFAETPGDVRVIYTRPAKDFRQTD